MSSTNFKRSEYDYLLVGAGIFNCTLARVLKDAGKKIAIVEKRQQIGGNCLDENRDGINIHLYGPHLWHTNNEEVYQFFTKYTPVYHFQYRPKVSYKGAIYSFPINKLTLQQLGIKDIKREPIKTPQNAEEQCLATIGKELYEKFFYHYTKKQWNREPKLLPTDIVKRIPVRNNYIDNYFDDKYQCLPSDGYSGFFKNITRDMEIVTGCDFLLNRSTLSKKANRIIYSGKIDEYFNYELGELEYRSLSFKHKFLRRESFQGSPVINYTDTSPFTRILEHKFFNPSLYNLKHTWITKEYPENWNKNKDAFYPVNNNLNNILYNKYKQLSLRDSKLLFVGRLGMYKYLNMDQTMASALSLAKQLLREK